MNRLALLLATMFCGALFASEARQFEAATVKASNSGTGVQGGCHGIDTSPNAREYTVPLGRCVISDGRLSHLINIAFHTGPMNTISGGPDWVTAGLVRFDVNAKTENPETATQEQLLTMLQTLLVERFKLKFHLEPKETTGYALVVGRRGLKLTDAADEKGAPEPVADFKAGREKLFMQKGEMVAFKAGKWTLPMFAQILSTMGIGQVFDQTELKGTYDFTLEFEGPETVASAVQDQLGLRLEPLKVITQFFVVEAAEKPAGN